MYRIITSFQWDKACLHPKCSKGQQAAGTRVGEGGQACNRSWWVGKDHGTLARLVPWLGISLQSYSRIFHILSALVGQCDLFLSLGISSLNFFASPISAWCKIRHHLGLGMKPQSIQVTPGLSGRYYMVVIYRGASLTLWLSAHLCDTKS